MEKKGNRFQTILLVVFGAFLILGVLVFAGWVPIGRQNQTAGLAGTIMIWGTMPITFFQQSIDTLQDENDGLTIKYIEKSQASFDDELVEAIATGVGPDLFVMPHDQIAKQQNKVYVIPYTSYPMQTFQSQYVDVADVLLSGTGILGFPLIVDPLVMYYNKNLLNDDFILNPPEFWNEYYDFAETVTDAQTITIDKAAVAMGSYDNITNSKALLSTLFLQTRNPITAVRGRQNVGTLINDYTDQRNFSAQIVNFYTSFTDPTLTHYSWNVGMPNDKQAFLAEDLAVYFGFASEARDFVRINPNINLGVALMPQFADQPKATFAKLQVVAINKQSRNLSLAFQMAQQLTGTRFGLGLSLGLQLPPVFSARLTPSADAPDYMQTFYNSAIISRTWLDPDPDATSAAFRRMIQDVNAGILGAESAVVRANQAITEAFPRTTFDLNDSTESIF